MHPRSRSVTLPDETSSTAAPHRSGARSVHFAASIEMPFRVGQPSVLGPSRATNAPYAPPSTAPSARSWVYPYNQHQPTPLPHSPTDQPTPLPGPFFKRKGVNLVNHLLDDDDDDYLDETETTQPNSLGIDFGTHHPQPEQSPSSKKKPKKSIIGRMFHGVGNVFGKESSSGDRKLKRKATPSYDTVPTLATYGDSSSGNTNPATYVADAPGPSSSSHLGIGYRVPHNVPTPILEVPESEEHGSPLPEVYRLSDSIPPLHSRDRPPVTISNHRPKSVSRKPVNAYATSSRLAEPVTPVDTAAGLNTDEPNLEDRTTVMIYEQNLSRVPTDRHTPPPIISRHPSSTREQGPPLQPLRPTSFVATQQTHAVREPVSVAPTRRTSIAAPPIPRSRQVSLTRGIIPGQAPSASSIPDFPPGPYPAPAISRATSIFHPPPPPLPIPLQTLTITNPEEDVVAAHPLPTTEDYHRMAHSPPQSSKHTATTFSSDPSSSADLGPFARFVKTLYRMPWISHDRVTVDYLPDHGLLGDEDAKRKREKKSKRMGTWYRSMMASRRSSYTDLIGRGGRRDRRRQRDLDASLGSALAEFSTKRRKRRTDKSRRHHHHHHSSSSRHHHRRHHHGRHTTATTATTTTSMTTDDDDDDHSVLQNGTPLALPNTAGMYPYFPPFPFAFQATTGTPFPQTELPMSPPATAGQTGAGTAGAGAYQPFFPQGPFYFVQQGAMPSPAILDTNAKPATAVPDERGGGHIPGAFS